jgi:hypothetical protein
MAGQSILYIDISPDDVADDSIPGIWGFSGKGSADGEGMWCLAGEDVDIDAPAFASAGMAYNYVFKAPGVEWTTIRAIKDALQEAEDEESLVQLVGQWPEHTAAAVAAAKIAWRASAGGGSFDVPESGTPTFDPVLLAQMPLVLDGFGATEDGNTLDGDKCEEGGYSLYVLDTSHGSAPDLWDGESRERLDASWAGDAERFDASWAGDAEDAEDA